MYEALNKVESKEDFTEFINILMRDFKENPGEWEDHSKPVISYLESIKAWVQDMDGYYMNTRQDVPKDINWNFIATLLYVGKIYE
jgi:hypothetical protein